MMSRNWFPLACGWGEFAKDSWAKKEEKTNFLMVPVDWAGKSISPGTIFYFDFLQCEIINSLLIKSIEPKFLVKWKAYSIISLILLSFYHL